MVDSADIYFIQHFADIYFSKFVCISVCGGLSSKSYLLPTFIYIYTPAIYAKVYIVFIFPFFLLYVRS